MLLAVVRHVMLAAATTAAAPDSGAPVTIHHGHVTDHPEWIYWEIAVDLSAASLRIVDRDGGALLESMLPADAIAAVNGGYFMANYRPTGWVRDKAREIAKPRATKKGGVVAVKGTQLYIGPQNAVPFKADFAIHNSPLLIEAATPGPTKGSAKEPVIGIRSDDGRPAPRTTVCALAAADAEAKPLRFIVLQPDLTKPGARGPTLMQTALLLAQPRSTGGFGCTAALNLDGGPSTGVWLKPGTFDAPSAPPRVPIGYGIVIGPKS